MLLQLFGFASPAEHDGYVDFIASRSLKHVCNSIEALTRTRCSLSEEYGNASCFGVCSWVMKKKYTSSRSLNNYCPTCRAHRQSTGERPQFRHGAHCEQSKCFGSFETRSMLGEVFDNAYYYFSIGRKKRNYTILRAPDQAG